MQEIKIGILDPLDPFLPVTETTKRAMKLTKQALQELGYTVVPFHISAETWRQSRDLLGMLLANGAARLQANDILQAGEPL